MQQCISQLHGLQMLGHIRNGRRMLDISSFQIKIVLKLMVYLTQENASMDSNKTENTRDK
jgi:hypothetical protein